MSRSIKKQRTATAPGTNSAPDIKVKLQQTTNRVSFDSTSDSSSDSDSDSDDSFQPRGPVKPAQSKNETTPTPQLAPQISHLDSSDSSDSDSSDSSDSDSSSDDENESGTVNHGEESEQRDDETQIDQDSAPKEQGQGSHFADQIPCDKGRPFLPETVEYFNTMVDMMREIPTMDPTQRSILLRTMFNELKGWEYRVLTRPSYTKLIAQCLDYATPAQVKQLWVGCVGKFGNLFLHQFTALAMQQLLVRAAEVLHTEHVNNVVFGFNPEEDDGDSDADSSDNGSESESDSNRNEVDQAEERAKRNPTQPMLTLFLNMAAEIRQYWPILMSSMHSSFITRTIILISMGCTEITQTMIKDGTSSPLNSKSHQQELKALSLLKPSKQLHEKITENPGLENIDELTQQNITTLREQHSLPQNRLQSNQLLSRAHVKGTETILEDLVTVVRLQTTECQENDYQVNWLVADMCTDPSLSPVLVCLLHALNYLRQTSPTPHPNLQSAAQQPHDIVTSDYFHNLLNTLILIILQWRYVGTGKSYTVYSNFNTTSPLSPHNFKSGDAATKYLTSQKITNTSSILALYQMQSQAQAIFSQLVEHPIGSRLLERVISTADHLITTNIYFKYIRRQLTHFCTDRFSNHIVQAIIPQLPFQFDILYGVVKDVLELDDSAIDAESTQNGHKSDNGSDSSSDSSSDSDSDSSSTDSDSEDAGKKTGQQTNSEKKIKNTFTPIPLPKSTTTLSKSILAAKFSKDLDVSTYEHNTFYSIVKAGHFGILYQLAVALQLPTIATQTTSTRLAQSIANSPMVLKVQQTVLKAFQDAMGTVHANQKPHVYLFNLSQFKFFPWVIKYPPVQPTTPPDMKHLGVMTIVAMFNWAVIPPQVLDGFKSLIDSVPVKAQPTEPTKDVKNDPRGNGKLDKLNKYGKNAKYQQSKHFQQQQAAKTTQVQAKVKSKDGKPIDFALMQLIKANRGGVLLEYFINSPRIEFKQRIAFIKALSGYYTDMICASPSSSHLVQSMYLLPFPSKAGINDQQYDRIMMELRTDIMREITEGSNAKKIRSLHHGNFLLTALHYDYYLSHRTPWTPTTVSKTLQRNINLFSDLLAESGAGGGAGGVKRKAQSELTLDDGF